MAMETCHPSHWPCAPHRKPGPRHAPELAQSPAQLMDEENEGKMVKNTWNSHELTIEPLKKYVIIETDEQCEFN